MGLSSPFGGDLACVGSRGWCRVALSLAAGFLVGRPVHFLAVSRAVERGRALGTALEMHIGCCLLAAAARWTHLGEKPDFGLPVVE